jgi:hypothetical protein
VRAFAVEFFDAGRRQSWRWSGQILQMKIVLSFGLTRALIIYNLFFVCTSGQNHILFTSEKNILFIILVFFSGERKALCFLIILFVLRKTDDVADTAGRSEIWKCIMG